MPVAMAIMFRRAPGRWVAVGALALAVVPAWAANAPIYKCLDSHLGLVYTDLPCKDGEQLDIRAGDADPAAVARLDRSLDQLDQSAAQRMQDDRRAAAATWLPRGPEDDASPPAEPYSYGNGYGYGYGFMPYPPFVRHVLHRPHRPHPVPRTVPAFPRNPRS